MVVPRNLPGWNIMIFLSHFMQLDQNFMIFSNLFYPCGETAEEAKRKTNSIPTIFISNA